MARPHHAAWVKPPGYIPKPILFTQETDHINGLAQMAAKEDKAAGRQHPPNATKVWKWRGQWTKPRPH